jgi:hypothetical protein
MGWDGDENLSLFDDKMRLVAAERWIHNGIFEFWEIAGRKKKR